MALLFCLLGSGVTAQEPVGQAESPAASPATQEAASQRPMISTGLGERALAERFPRAAVWLENSEGGAELALFAPADRPEAKGALLLLADEGQSGGGGFEGAVRQLLPERGWAVMTLGLPPAPLGQPLAQPDRAADEPEAEATETAVAASGRTPAQDESVMIDVMAPGRPEERLQRYRQRLGATLAAALAELQGRGHRRVVVAGVGLAAWPVMQVAGASGEPMELVWIAPRFAAGVDQAWAERLAGVERWPLLDLASSLGNRAEARARAAEFRRQGVAGYQQQVLTLPLPLSERDAPQLVNRVVAWLARAGG